MTKTKKKNAAAQALVKLRFDGLLSREETRAAALRLMARLHTREAVAAEIGKTVMTVGNYLNGKTRASRKLLIICDKVTDFEVSKETS